MERSNTNGVNTNANYQFNTQKPSGTAVPQPVDLLLGIKNLAECFVGTFDQNFAAELYSLKLNADATFIFSKINKNQQEVIESISGKWEIQQKINIDLSPARVSLKSLYSSCSLSFKCESMTKKSLTERYSSTFTREGRLESAIGEIVIPDVTFGKQVWLKGVPERIALQLDIMKESTPMNIEHFQTTIQELIRNCSVSEAFTRLKNQLIRIEYKFIHFNNLIEDGLRSLKVIGDLWVNLYDPSTFAEESIRSQEYFGLLIHLLTQILDGIGRNSHQTDAYKDFLLNLKNSVTVWETKSGENSPNEFKTLSAQAKNYLQHIKDGSILDLQDNNTNGNNTQPQNSNNNPRNNNMNGHNTEYSDISDHDIDDEPISVVDENADPEEYTKLFQLVHEQKTWIDQRVSEIQQQIELGNYPYLKTDLRKYLS